MEHLFQGDIKALNTFKFKTDELANKTLYTLAHQFRIQNYSIAVNINQWRNQKVDKGEPPPPLSEIWGKIFILCYDCISLIFGDKP
jgi:hypothetical protein